MDKRRIVISVVMVLSLLAFVGFSLAPLIDSIVKANQVNSQVSPSPLQSGASIASDLQAQVRGYELVLQREPDNQAALKGLLQLRLELVRLKQGEIKDVIPPLEKLSKLNPENTEYSILLAQAKEYTGDVEGSAQSYRGILNTQPGNIQALQGLVNLLLKQKRPEAAIGLLQDTLKAAPMKNQTQPGSVDVGSVQLVLGQVYAEQKRYDEALAVYEEGIKLDGKDFRPVLAKGIILRQQGKTQDSQKVFMKAIELAPAQYKDQVKLLAKGETTAPTTPAKSPASESLPPSSPSPSPSGQPTSSPSPVTSPTP